MARSELPPGVNKALAYWGIIELAAETHATTADLWGWIRDSAEELGLASPGVRVQAVSYLRGVAGQIQERSRLFGQLADSRRITGRYVSIPPWARDPGAQRALPMTQVRYRHTYLHNGDEITQWRTSMLTGRLNHTAGSLREIIELDAMNLAREYGTEHLGVDSLQIMAV